MPGAWRRAKFEEEERSEIKDDTSSPRISKSIHNSCIVKSSENSTVSNDPAPSITASSLMFDEPLVKACTAVVQFIEAPFPKVTHVRQQEQKYTKWNLSMIRNKFVKEEYFFTLGKLEIYFSPLILLLCCEMCG